jgi:predicted outer membrane repeat protein
MRRVVGPVLVVVVGAVGAVYGPAPSADAGVTLPPYVVDSVAVTNDGTCDTTGGCTLPDAITEAEADGALSSIAFSVPPTSTITLTAPLPTVTQFLEIDGGTADITIDANDTGRIFNSSGILTLRNLTLLDGVATEGGAVFHTGLGNELTLSDVDFTSNVATTGAGGAVRSEGAVSVSGDSDFVDNQAATGGGAIRAESSIGVSGAGEFRNNDITGNGNGGAIESDFIVNVTGGADFSDNNTPTSGVGGCIAGGNVGVAPGSEFVDNSAQHGGGCIFGEFSVGVRGVQFRGNKSLGNGGGAITSSTVTVADSTFGGPSPGDANTASLAGGAIYSDGATTVSVDESTFLANSVTNATSTSGGGAIAVDDPDLTLNVDNSTFDANTVPGTATEGNGGAIFVMDGDANIVNSTFRGNTAGKSGGAVAVTGTGATEMTHSTVIGGGANTAVLHNLEDPSSTFALGSTILANQEFGSLCTGTFGALGYNMTSPGGSSCASGGTNLPEGNPLLGPFGDNGGPTLTFLPLTFSAVIDAIPDTDCDEARDQRGATRPFDTNCDVGAVEHDLQADGLIAKSGQSLLGLEVIHDAGAGQSVTQKKPKGKTATYDLQIRNDSEFSAEGGLTVTGGAGSNKFKVQYLDGAADVTAAITTGAYQVALGPQDARDLVMKVKVKSKAKPGNKLTTLVTLTSGGRSDTVKAVTKRK